jgi:hypothetical protein
MSPEKPVGAAHPQHQAVATSKSSDVTKFKHLEVESLTVTCPHSKAKVDILLTQGGSGIWLSTGNGQECVGICAQPGMPPYLVFHESKAAFPPPLAISESGFQLKDPTGATPALTFDLETLVKALRDHQNPPLPQ